MSTQVPLDPAAFRFEAAPPVFAPPPPEDDRQDDSGLSGPSRPRTFAGLAYSGEVIGNHWAWGALVIDLDSLILPDACPCLMNHDRDDPVGVCTLSVQGGALLAAGKLLNYGKGRDVADAADQGFPWQLSIYAEPGLTEEVQPGTAVAINGRSFTGPLTVFRQSRIRELSLTPTGYDHRTYAQVLSQPGILPLATTSSFVTPEVTMTVAAEPNPDLTAQVAALTAQVSELTARAENAEATLAASKTAAREQALLSLFAELGRPCPEASKPHYLSLSDEAFAALAADLRASRPAAPANLFSEQVQGPASGPLDGKADARLSLNPADIYAARRAC